MLNIYVSTQFMEDPQKLGTYFCRRCQAKMVKTTIENQVTFVCPVCGATLWQADIPTKK